MTLLTSNQHYLLLLTKYSYKQYWSRGGQRVGFLFSCLWERAVHQSIVRDLLIAKLTMYEAQHLWVFSLNLAGSKFDQILITDYVDYVWKTRWTYALDFFVKQLVNLKTDFRKWLQNSWALAISFLVFLFFT